MSELGGYNPEFWTTDGVNRHRVMPAFGALLTDDYRTFIEGEVAEDDISPTQLARDVALKNDMALGVRDENARVSVDEEGNIDDGLIQFTRPYTEGVYLLKELYDRVGYLAELHSGNRLLTTQLTYEQSTWVGKYTHHGGVSLQRFQQQSLASGFSSLYYFGTAAIAEWALDEQREAPESIEELLRGVLMKPKFIEGLHQAGSAPESFWSIPDIGVRPQAILGKALRISGGEHTRTQMRPFELQVEDGLIHPYLLHKMRAMKKARFEKVHPNNATSGCPVRHGKLGPHMLQAFTEGQLERIGTVADIDPETGVITYRWNAFDETYHTFVPKILEVAAAYDEWKQERLIRTMQLRIDALRSHDG